MFFKTTGAILFFLFVLCALGMLTKSTHLLSFLISLEFLGLSVLLNFVMVQSNFLGVLLMSLFLLGAMGCESAIGLILFVLLTRRSSKDYLMQMSILKF